MATSYSTKLPEGCVWKADPGYRKFPATTTFTGTATTIGSTPTPHMEFTGQTGQQKINFPQLTLNEFTICYFFYHDELTNNDMTFGFDGDTQNRFYHRDAGTDYRLRVHNNLNVSVGDLVLGDIRQQWAFLAYGMGGGNRRGWVNGVNTVNISDADSSVFVVNSFGAPFSPSPTSYFWNGKLGPVHIFDRLLEPSEGIEIFNLNKNRFGL